MDDSDKGFSSSTPIKPSLMPKCPSPGRTDENGLNYEMKNPKKPITKHFMSPTISAASKVAVPRKKILAERYQDLKFSDTHNQNVPILDSKTSGRYSRSSSSRLTPLNSSASESDDDDDENSFVANSSLKPYDPLTNYLSPRPKFLRFKPNRHPEVFLHRENGIREGKGGSGFRRTSASFDSQKANVDKDSPADALLPYSQVGSVRQGNGVHNSEEDDSDEEIEEFEGNGLTLKGVLKFLLLFVVLFLSTSYISSMNSPTPSPTLLVIRGLKDEFYKIQNLVFEAVTMNIHEGGSEFFDSIEEVQLGSLRVNERPIESGFEKREMVENGNSELVESSEVYGEMVDLQHGRAEKFSHGEMEKTQKVFDVLKGTQIAQSEDVDQLKGPEIGESYGVYDQELKDTVEGSENLQEIEIADDTDFGDHELEKKEKPTPLIALSVSEKKVTVDSNSIDERIGSVIQIDVIDGFFDGGVGKDVVQNEMERIEDITMNSGDEIDILEAIDIESTISDTINPRAAVMGAAIFSISVASLCLVFHLRHKRASVKCSLPLGDSIHEPMIADKISPILFHVEEDQEIQNPKTESFVNPKSLVPSMEEESRGFYRFHSPRVELLAEFAVGERRESSSSLKSCGMKSRMMETIESNTCVSQEKVSLSKLVSEFSTMESPSYGSCFTAEKKIVKKEERKDGEVRKVGTTPVRRSSRIHNRSIMSP